MAADSKPKPVSVKIPRGEWHTYLKAMATLIQQGLNHGDKRFAVTDDVRRIHSRIAIQTMGSD